MDSVLRDFSLVSQRSMIVYIKKLTDVDSARSQDLALFASLIIHTFQLLFSAGTVFFSQTNQPELWRSGPRKPFFVFKTELVDVMCILHFIWNQSSMVLPCESAEHGTSKLLLKTCFPCFTLSLKEFRGFLPNSCTTFCRLGNFSSSVGQ